MPKASRWRDVRECMVGAVAIRLQEPMFESQTKNKLGNTEIRSELVTKVREEVLHLLHQDKKVGTPPGQGGRHAQTAQGAGR